MSFFEKKKNTHDIKYYKYFTKYIFTQLNIIKVAHVLKVVKQLTITNIIISRTTYRKTII